MMGENKGSFILSESITVTTAGFRFGKTKYLVTLARLSSSNTLDRKNRNHNEPSQMVSLGRLLDVSRLPHLASAG